MATPAQIFANRENSKASTGPRTPEGKDASSHNATADGFYAADPVLPSEDRNQFNTLRERYNSDFSPFTAHEEFLVSQMTGARWKLDRVERIEVAIFTALDNQGDPATADARMAAALLEKDFAKRNVTRVSLTTRFTREDAHGFYDALGYSRTGFRFAKIRAPV